MVSVRTLWSVALGMGLLSTIWAAPARAADKPAKPAPTTAPDAGVMAYFERFKSAVDAAKLSDDTQKKADAMLEAAHQDLKALDELSDRAEAKKKAHVIFQKLGVDISTLLTDEQKQEFVKKLQGANASVATSVMIDKIKEQLSKPEMELTDAQKKQVDDLLDETKRKLEELRVESQGGKDVRGKVRDALQQMKVNLTKILSPDQLKNLGGGGAKPAQTPKSNSDSKQ
jgi:hypothetical protein